jgi:hypothetical protein
MIQEMQTEWLYDDLGNIYLMNVKDFSSCQQTRKFLTQQDF